MAESVLERHLLKGGTLAEELRRHGDQDPDAADDLGCFGWLRGVRERALMLELRKRDGNIVAVPYAYIERMEYDPSEGIALLVPGFRVVLKGRDLNAEVRPQVRLFDGLVRHRVPWVRDAQKNAIDSAGPSILEIGLS